MPSAHRSISLVLLPALAFLSFGCSKATTQPGGPADGAGGSASAGGAGGSAGATGAGGASGGAGGVGAILDAGLGGALDAGLGAILDSGLGALTDAALAPCPSNPVGKACGGSGMPLACVQSGGGAGGCLCLQQQWVCPSLPGGLDAGGPMQPRPACPANAANTTCPMLGTICTHGQDAGAGGCACLPGANNTLVWRCSPQP